MPDHSKNVWAPWRMEYIEQLHDDDEGDCFLCHYRETPDRDADHRVLWRTDRTIVLMNKYPYTGGHLLVAPLEHIGVFEDVAEDVLFEMTTRLRDAKRVLERALHPQGFNVGLNLGRCAGAGLPEHLHWHVVPRWNGDTNFMSVCGDVRVVPEALQKTYERIRQAAIELGFGTA